MENAPLLMCLYFYRRGDLPPPPAGYTRRSHEGEQGQADSGRLRHRDRSPLGATDRLQWKPFIVGPGDLLAVGRDFHIGVNRLRGVAHANRALQWHGERPPVEWQVSDRARVH